MSRSLSVIVTTHNQQYKPSGGGICVANHTSPIDVIILSCDNAYALVGQLQGGLLGILERALDRATSHVFFDRFSGTDRTKVTQRLREHAADKDKLPILIFPEGDRNEANQLITQNVHRHLHQQHGRDDVQEGRI